MPDAPRSARARARHALTADIKALAVRQLAEVGAQNLSLRAVSRELGMASSALYRYFPSRDHLLTALIVDAYGDLADAVEGAVAAVAPAADASRWVAGWEAVRRWARAHPHRFGLLYGTPVIGYAAPEDTIAPAARVMGALLRVVGDAAAAGRLRAHVPAAAGAGGSDAEGELDAQLATLAGALELDAPTAALAAAIAGVAQLIGVLALELGGHLVGTFEPADALVGRMARGSAAAIGLVDGAAEVPTAT